MIPVKQTITSSASGDCWRACMASILELPIEILPNDHSDAWFLNWKQYLKQFGLGISYYGNPKKDPMWADHHWIASVKSLNYKNTYHAIVMHEGGVVAHDPSIKNAYETGQQMLGSDVVVEGFHLVVRDASKLHLLNEYRERLKNEQDPIHG